MRPRLAGRLSSAVVADAFCRRPAGQDFQPAAGQAGDDEPASQSIAGLLEAMRYAPIFLGRIDAGGALLGLGGLLVLKNLVEQG